ncbi:WD40 repeat-like protein [Rhizopogon salebrosus TDB-379]|nr:WD40 repeat-like protein [Rhizopogon salebrosus TDB-379]
MTSISTQKAVASTNSTLTPEMTMEGHKDSVSFMSYLPDGKTMISGSLDMTVRRWDLQAAKEIEDARYVCEEGTEPPGPVTPSRDGRWVITQRELEGSLMLKAHEVETGTVRVLQGHSEVITCIDICADSMLLANYGYGAPTVRIWSLETGKLVAAVKSDLVCAVRFSHDSKKLAVNSDMGKCLEVWDVQTQGLDARLGKVFTSNVNDKFPPSFPTTIHEFDSSTLETVGAPFERHTDYITDLALSFDGALLATSGYDTIKLWSFESRQLLASFHARNVKRIIFSPDIRQLAYTRLTFPGDDDDKLYIYNTPPNILSGIGSALEVQSLHKTRKTLEHVLESEATRRRANTRQNLAASPVISFPTRTRRHYQPRDPLDVPIPSPSAQATSQGPSRMDSPENSRHTPAPNTFATAPITFRTRLSAWWFVRAGHAALPVLDVPLAQGKQRHATAGAPKNDDDLVPAEYSDDPSSVDPNVQHASTAMQLNTGEHGSRPLCCCL